MPLIALGVSQNNNVKLECAYKERGEGHQETFNLDRGYWEEGEGPGRQKAESLVNLKVSEFALQPRLRFM